MLTHNIDYHDLGGDYFTRQDPERTMHRIIRQANTLGFTLRFDPIPSRLTSPATETNPAPPGTKARPLTNYFRVSTPTEHGLHRPDDPGQTAAEPIQCHDDNDVTLAHGVEQRSKPGSVVAGTRT